MVSRPLMALNLDHRAFRLGGWIGIAALGVSIPILAILGSWVGVLVVLPFFVISLVFVIWDERLPALFDLVFVTAALLNAGGYAWELYHIVPAFDALVHLCTIFAFAMSFGWLTFRSMHGDFDRHRTLFFVAIASFGIAIGAFWEVFEWGFRFIGDVPDTMIDLVLDMVGALGAAGLCVRALSRANTDRRATFRGAQRSKEETVGDAL